jgi:hypothetical protein
MHARRPATKQRISVSQAPLPASELERDFVNGLQRNGAATAQDPHHMVDMSSVDEALTHKHSGTPVRRDAIGDHPRHRLVSDEALRVLLQPIRPGEHSTARRVSALSVPAAVTSHDGPDLSATRTPARICIAMSSSCLAL